MLIGTVVGLHGKETDAGDFLVLDVLEAGLPPQIELPLKSSTLFTLQIFFFAEMFVLGHLFL